MIRNYQFVIVLHQVLDLEQGIINVIDSITPQQLFLVI